METLTLRTLTFVSGNEIEIIFDADDGTEVVYRFTVNIGRKLTVIKPEPAFSERFRMVPGPALPMWPEQLVAAAWRARHQPLPEGRTLDQMKAAVLAKLSESQPQ